MHALSAASSRARRALSSGLPFAVPVTAVTIAFVTTAVLKPLLPAETFSLFFLAVLVSAWYAGRAAAALAILLASCFANYFFLPPLGTLSITTSAEAAAITVFSVVSLGAAEAVHRLRHRAALAWAENSRQRSAVSAAHKRAVSDLRLLRRIAEVEILTGAEFVPTTDVERLGNHAEVMAAVHAALAAPSASARPHGDVGALNVIATVVDRLSAGRVDRQATLRVDGAGLPVDKAVPLAIVAAELVQNAWLHGNGAVEVVFERRDSSLFLRVQDAGPGFPTDFDPTGSAYAGLAIVNLVVREDLLGTVTFGKSAPGGASVEATFPSESTSRSAD